MSTNHDSNNQPPTPPPEQREPLKQEIYRDNQIKRGMKSIRIWLPNDRVDEFKEAAHQARRKYAADNKAD